jgi:hypothetical protein
MEILRGLNCIKKKKSLKKTMCPMCLCVKKKEKKCVKKS